MSNETNTNNDTTARIAQPFVRPKAPTPQPTVQAALSDIKKLMGGTQVAIAQPLLPAHGGALAAVMFVKEKQVKVALDEAGEQIIGLNLAERGLTDAQWDAIVAALPDGGTALRALNLSGNKLTTFDATPFPNLEKLRLSDNKIRTFLWAQGWTRRLVDLDLGGNPLEGVPPEVLGRGRHAVLAHFQDIDKQGVVRMAEAKLLLVGEGGAGKTSLMRRLFQPEKDMPKEYESTKGIEIHRHDFDLKDGQKFRLNVWDFGGQEIYHATHQFFLTRRSIYVLLDDTRKDHKTVHDEGFKYWLEVIDLLSEHSKVLIFQNEKSGRSKQIDLAGIKGKFDNVVELFGGNLQNKGAADAIRNAIEFYASELPHAKEDRPRQWANIRADLEARSEDDPHITCEAYFEIFKKHLDWDRDKALAYSRDYHDLGVCLHFQEDKVLKNLVILKNSWATEAVFKMLDDETVKQDNMARFDALDCRRVWRDSQWADKHDELLALMEKFELCYPLHDERTAKWLIPQLLPQEKPVVLFDWPRKDGLVLRFKYQFLPKGLVSRLTVRKQRYVKTPDLCWASGAYFEHNGAQLLAEIPQEGDQIVLRTRGREQRLLLEIIAEELKALNASFPDFAEKVKMEVPCNCEQCATGAGEPHFFDYKKLKNLLDKQVFKAQCNESGDMVDIQRLINDYFPEDTAHGLGRGRQSAVEAPEKGHAKPLKVFISYSKHDREEFLEPMITFLRPLVLGGWLETWNDHDITAGEEWDDAIRQQLATADIILLLVSAKSLNTDYIWNVEIKAAMERHEKGDSRVVPIILSQCDWKQEHRNGEHVFPLARLNALPAKGIPVNDYAKMEHAWQEVADGLKSIITAWEKKGE
jgi:internalin A